MPLVSRLIINLISTVQYGQTNEIEEKDLFLEIEKKNLPCGISTSQPVVTRSIPLCSNVNLSFSGGNLPSIVHSMPIGFGSFLCMFFLWLRSWQPRWINHLTFEMRNSTHHQTHRVLVDYGDTACRLPCNSHMCLETLSTIAVHWIILENPKRTRFPQSTVSKYLWSFTALRNQKVESRASVLSHERKTPTFCETHGH